MLKNGIFKCILLDMAFKSVRIYTFIGEMNALLMNPLGFKRINSTINVRILTDSLANFDIFHLKTCKS